ncbi:PREDICTED: uncharacterized protein LOC101619831 [Condylura cristata]|nr:PREDICTED: uncharacterized protein LOC101619831 [Condylura cristata]
MEGLVEQVSGGCHAPPVDVRGAQAAGPPLAEQSTGPSSEGLSQRLAVLPSAKAAERDDTVFSSAYIYTREGVLVVTSPLPVPGRLRGSGRRLRARVGPQRASVQAPGSGAEAARPLSGEKLDPRIRHCSVEERSQGVMYMTPGKQGRRPAECARVARRSCPGPGCRPGSRRSAQLPLASGDSGDLPGRRLSVLDSCYLPLQSVSQSVFCGTSTYCVLNTVPPIEDDHGNSNSSHVKIFLPKKLLECLPKCSSLPKERHRWNTNERSCRGRPFGFLFNNV